MEAVDVVFKEVLRLMLKCNIDRLVFRTSCMCSS